MVKVLFMVNVVVAVESVYIIAGSETKMVIIETKMAIMNTMMAVMSS
jgi:hypothetical protein